MTYEILPYSYEKAKLLGVQIKPSNRKNKKIDVFKDGKYLYSIGDNRYLDFPNYVKKFGLTYANEKRNAYWSRHHKENIPNTRGWYSLHILW